MGTVSALVDGVMTEIEDSVIGEIPVIEPHRKTILSKASLWRRLTDQEAESLDAALAAAPIRLRRIYEGASYLDTTDPDYPDLRAGVEAALGLGRAAEVLEPES